MPIECAVVLGAFKSRPGSAADVALVERRPDLSAPVRAGDLILRLGREKWLRRG